ncbi:ferredoxin [Paraburkholderia oxyphila]|uniref:ferredoxin n=1 Tax=Paraburkholderia oxyphila TaxID=614212 RepID=UPI000489BD91|nr:ferredoxin [Paraburkholderia oxyphila]
MKLVVDKSRCIGAGQCVLKAPRVFDQQEDDGMVILLAESPSAEDQDAARLAARVCPAEAIVVVED